MAARCGANVDISDVMLLADELVSNAMLHAGEPSEIVVAGSSTSLWVEVIDPSPALPTLARSRPGQDWGYGLVLVERLASTWGAERLPVGGKTVWFEVHAARRPAGE
jgi:anti-sigma regulatory factor (Ser/Thr protein kinase)